jgi:DNA-binding MarR family transcriptional regulator
MTSYSNPQVPNSEEQVAQFKKFNEHNLVRLVRETYRQVTSNVNKRLEECGFGDLSARHLSIFDHLDYEGTNIVTLANRAGISKQAMSKLVKEVTVTGYISVKTDVRDSRIVVVSFTEKGMKFLTALRTEINKAREAILKTDAVTMDEVSVTTNTLSKLLTYFEIGSNKALMN